MKPESFMLLYSFGKELTTSAINNTFKRIGGYTSQLYIYEFFTDCDNHICYVKQSI
jgi:hypothetical protein